MSAKLDNGKFILKGQKQVKIRKFDLRKSKIRFTSELISLNMLPLKIKSTN